MNENDFGSDRKDQGEHSESTTLPTLYDFTVEERRPREDQSIKFFHRVRLINFITYVKF